MKKILATVMVASLALAMPVMSAQAAERGVRVGVLTCKVKGGVGLILGSTKSAVCRFSSRYGWEERYLGSLSRIGADIGVTKQATIVWAVFAPGKIKRGSLAGGYVGAGAEATVGAGVGANILVGGFRKSINLQPVSIQGQTGLNVAAGFGSLTLRRG